MIRKFIFCLILILIPSTSLAEGILVVILNKENPVHSLSQGEVQRLFLLKSKYWPHGDKIQPINRNKGSVAKKTFVRSILKMSPHYYDQFWIGTKQLSGETEPKSVRSNKFVLKIVSKNKNAIGYLPQEYIDQLDSTSKSKIKAVLEIKN